MIRASVAPFIFGSTVVIFLFLMQFLMKTLDKLIGKGLDNIVIVQLITYNIAWMVVLAVPMGVLFASLVAFGNLSANHEVTVMKASGGSLIRLMTPLVVLGALVSVIMFWYSDYVLPETNHAAKMLGYDVQRTKPALSIEAGQFSSDIEGYTILARHVDTNTNILHSVTIYDQRNAALNRTISAETCKIRFSADMSKLIFHMTNGEIHQSRINDVKNYRIIRFGDYSVMTPAYGFGFERSEDGSISRQDREMCIADMRKVVDEANAKRKVYEERRKNIIRSNYSYIMGLPVDTAVSEESAQEIISAAIRNRDMRAANPAEIPNMRRNIAQFSNSMQAVNSNISSSIERANAYMVEIYKKYAMSFACIVFVFVGCPLGIVTRGGNFGLSAAITLGFYILYWACLISGEKLADRSQISPAVSMWLGNIIVGIMGIILTIKVNNESFSFASFLKRLPKGIVPQKANE